MSTICVCDLCKKRMYVNENVRHFKVKELKSRENFRYERIDVHANCIKELLINKNPFTDDDKIAIREAIDAMEFAQEYIMSIGEKHSKTYVDRLDDSMKKLIDVIHKEDKE